MEQKYFVLGEIKVERGKRRERIARLRQSTSFNLFIFGNHFEISMKLPADIILVIDEHKITDYLLNENSVDGKAKAEFFFQNGITLQQPEILEKLLLEQAQLNDYTKTQQTFFGLKYIFETAVSFPNGKVHFIRSVWIENKMENVLKFVTAYKITL